MSATLPELRNYIDGEISLPSLERGSSVCNANTGEPIQPQLSCSPTQVERALAATHAAWQEGEWEHTPAATRADLLDKVADVLARPENVETIAYADVFEMAKAEDAQGRRPDRDLPARQERL